MLPKKPNSVNARYQKMEYTPHRRHLKG